MRNTEIPKIYIEKEKLEMEKVDLLKTQEGREMLAREFAEMMVNDETQPQPHRDNWVSETALRGFESSAFPKRLEAEFAMMCEMAAAMTEEKTSKRVFELQQINGLRRLPEGRRNDKLIKEHFAEAKKSIEELDDSPRKDRLLGLWSYNSSIYSRVKGDYLMAAESQEIVARLAEKTGDYDTRAIANFCITVERINHALVNGPENLKPLLKTLEDTGNVMYENVQGKNDPTSVRWEMHNGPAHLMLAHFWANEKYEGADADCDRLLSLQDANPEMAQGLNSGIAMALAAYFYIKGQKKDAKRLALYVLDGSAGVLPSPEYVASMHLLIGRIAVAEGNMAEAESRLREAASIEGSAHQVRAVAARELENLKA